MTTIAQDLAVTHGLGPTGLRLRPGMEWEEWLMIGAKLRNVQNATAWALGDWFFYGEWEYGSKYEAAAAVTGLAYQTLADLKYVAGRYEFSRRREDLSLSHHREVAALPLDEQDKWLDVAEERKWTREQFRLALAGKLELADVPPLPASRQQTASSEPPATERPDLQLVSETGPSSLTQLPLIVDGEQLRRWVQAASTADMTVEEWIRNVCDEAA